MQLNVFKLIFSLLVILAVASIPVFAAIDVVDFETDAMRKQYQKLTEELRCPKCPNQNLVGTESQIAFDLRREVARLLKEGKTENQIKTYMVNRYGEFVLYEPPVNAKTSFLWFTPFAILAIAFITFGVVVYRRSQLIKKDKPDADETL